MVAFGLALALRMSNWELAMVVLLIAFVLAAELFNTAVETIVDLVSPEYHPLAKTAKDVSAAGVLVCAFGAVVIGALLYVPAVLRVL